MHAYLRKTVPGQALVLLAFVATCLTVGALGGAITSTSVGTWYPQLRKPSFNPPDWVFTPVWIALYVAMAVAAWQVWRRRGLQQTRFAMTLFASQLALNLGWSILFFGLRQIGLALVEIVVLITAVGSTVFVFARADRTAALLLAPYIAWISFAALLNFAIWQLN
jgi:translocator protein